MIRHIHAETKMELAHLIVKCAPEGERSFEIKQKLPPHGYLVKYGPGGLSIKKLADELGVPLPQKPKISTFDYVRQGEIWNRWRHGKNGLITWG